MTVVVTGANGFIGSAILESLLSSGVHAVGTARLTSPNCVGIGQVDEATNWRAVLQGCEVLVHTAARVHQMNPSAAVGPDPFQTTNVKGTINLAKQAASAGVKRLIFLSSIKAMGESGFFSDDTPCSPQDAYGRSKLDAELALQEISAETGLETVILRLPLVYGPRVKGNFVQLYRMVERGLPLPLGAISNQRSLLYVGNLIDLIKLCIRHEKAPSRVWLPSDGSPISTPYLVRAIADALNVVPRIFHVPPSWISLTAAAVGKSDVANRLTGDLAVDSRPLVNVLGWRPPHLMAEGLMDTAMWFKQSQR